MKKILFLGLLIGLAACSKRIFVEREPNVFIETYKTYDWNELDVTNSKSTFYNNRELNSKIMQNIDKELAKKGLKKAENPDFLVDFHIFVEEGKYLQEYCPTGYYREGRYSQDLKDWPMCESPSIRSFDDGSLIIDIVDNNTKQLVWRGSAGGIIDFNENIPKILTSKVAKVVRKLPVNQ